MAYIKKVRIKGQDYDIHAADADSAKTASVAERTQGKLHIGDIEFDGSQDVSIDTYKGEVDEDNK